MGHQNIIFPLEKKKGLPVNIFYYQIPGQTCHLVGRLHPYTVPKKQQRNCALYWSPIAVKTQCNIGVITRRFAHFSLQLPIIHIIQPIHRNKMTLSLTTNLKWYKSDIAKTQHHLAGVIYLTSTKSLFVSFKITQNSMVHHENI